MVIFSHRGIGFGKKENSLEAITSVAQKGFSVEVDLRTSGNDIILSHDRTENHCDVAEFAGLLKIIKDNPEVFFALHLKEDSQRLFKGVGSAIRSLKNCFLFVTDFKQDSFIKEMFEAVGREHLALYVTDKNKDLELADKVDYFWLDETRGAIYKEIAYFLRFNKNIICCSPEVFSSNYQESLKEFRSTVNSKNSVFGICTDFPHESLKDKGVRCPACESEGPFENVDEVNDYLIKRCNSCHLEFASSMRYDVMYYQNLHYAEDYNLNNVLVLSREDFLDKAAGLLKDADWVPHNTVFSWIEKNLKKGARILDIGCGVGWFVAALESQDYNAMGIEVSTKVVDMLKDKGFQVYLGPLEKINVNIPLPELIVLLGVIEHVEDPVRLLGEIRRRFPESMLLISIPSPKRWDFGMGIRNYWDYPPNHLTPYWSCQALEIVLKKAGFRLIDWVFPAPINAEIWFVFVDLLLFRLGMRKKGYFVGLTNKLDKSSNLFKDTVKLFYGVFEKINFIARTCSQPLLNLQVRRLVKKSYSGLSAFAIAAPR